MTSAKNANVDISEPSSFPVRFAEGPSVRAISVDDLNSDLHDAILARKGVECTLSVRHVDSSNDRRGKHEVPQSSAALLWNSNEQRFDLRSIDFEYRFTHHTGGQEQSDDEPDPSNPYDYRHYLDRPIMNGVQSPALSAISTPMHVSTPYATSPLILPHDTEARPGSSRGALAAKRRPYDTGKPTARSAAQHPHRISAPLEQSQSSGWIIDDGSEPSYKRQRLDAAQIRRPMSISPAENTPRDMNQVASSPLPIEDLDSEAESHHDDNMDDANDDVEELELPAPASGRPQGTVRRKSVLNADELQALYNAFEEEPATEAIGSYDQEAIVSESESEEE